MSKAKTHEAKARQIKHLRRGGKIGRPVRRIDIGIFCISFLRNNSVVEATCRDLKIGKGTAYKLLKSPAFDQEIGRAREALINETAKVAAKKIVREITIDRNDIIMGLADVAQSEKTGDRAKVAAYLGLADIFMVRAKNVRDLSKFAGWTADELERFALAGEVPERFRSDTGPSPSSDASLRVEKN